MEIKEIILINTYYVKTSYLREIYAVVDDYFSEEQIKNVLIDLTDSGLIRFPYIEHQNKEMNKFFIVTELGETLIPELCERFKIEYEKEPYELLKFRLIKEWCKLKRLEIC